MKHERRLITSLDGQPDEAVLTMDDVAAILRISSSKAGEMCARAQIMGAFRIGNRIRIQAIDLRKKIASEKLPKNIDIFNLRQSLSSRGRRPKRNITDGRLRMTVAQLMSQLEKLPKNVEIAVGGDLADGKLKL